MTIQEIVTKCAKTRKATPDGIAFLCLFNSEIS